LLFKKSSISTFFFDFSSALSEREKNYSPIYQINEQIIMTNREFFGKSSLLQATVATNVFIDNYLRSVNKRRSISKNKFLSILFLDFIFMSKISRFKFKSVFYNFLFFFFSLFTPLDRPKMERGFDL